jgi:hypothetical protein
MATMNVKDAAGVTVAVEKPLAPGRAAAAASRPVALSSEDKASLDAISAAIGGATYFPATQPVSGAVSVSGPVAVTGTFWQATQPVSAASLPLPTGAATSAKQDAQTALLTTIDSKLAGTINVAIVSGGGGGTGGDASAANQVIQTGHLAAIEAAVEGVLAVAGTVSVSGPVAVTGTFYPATQPVSIAATVPVSGPLTDGQLRASAVAVSGPLTDGQLRASAVPVSAAALPLPAGAATNAKLDELIAGVVGNEYETVAAGQTDQVLGAGGAVGDLLVQLLIVPASTSPGAVSIRDGAGGPVITVFVGGADSLATLHPFPVVLNLRAASAGWRVTTGANVSVIGSGNFT